jgi:P-type E1-E2 ATPase
MINYELLEGCSALDFTIHEDLGDVDYIFSDKTGPLTANQLSFQGCSVEGMIF